MTANAEQHIVSAFIDQRSARL